MDEEGQVNGGLPGQDVPGHRAFAKVTIGAWHDAGEHREEAGRGDRGFAIEGERASALADDLSGGRLSRVSALRRVARTRYGLRMGIVLREVDRLFFGARLPGGPFRPVDVLPMHRIAVTQAVGLAVPGELRQVADGIHRKR